MPILVPGPKGPVPPPEKPLKVKLTSDQRQALQALAEARGVKVPALVRRWIRQQLKAAKHG